MLLLFYVVLSTNTLKTSILTADLINDPYASGGCNPLSSVHVAIKEKDWLVRCEIAADDCLDDIPTLVTYPSYFRCYYWICTVQLSQPDHHLLKTLVKLFEYADVNQITLPLHKCGNFRDQQLYPCRVRDVEQYSALLVVPAFRDLRCRFCGLSSCRATSAQRGHTFTNRCFSLRRQEARLRNIFYTTLIHTILD